MMDSANRCASLLFLFVFFLPLSTVSASDLPAVTLVSPAEGNVSVSNNITFICNAVGDENVYNISLYHNINGYFELYQTKHIMELEEDSNTTLLCHFDNSYICEDGEAGTSASTSFTASRFMKGVYINGSGTLRYQTVNNIEYDHGTIEFWARPSSDPGSNSYLYFFSTGSEYQNEMGIYSYGGILHFVFYDNYGDYSDAQANISFWNAGEWHHVAAIWDVVNGFEPVYDHLDLFIDGSNEDVTHRSDFSTYGLYFNPYMYIGSHSSGQYQANSTIDEFRISEWPRSPAEINASYQKGAGNHSNEYANWTLINISDGTYVWNCLAYDNESQGSWNDTNYSFSIDAVSPPSVNGIILSPSSADDIDPGINVSVTANVTDVSNVSAVMLQYKAPLAGAYTNDSMDYSQATGLWENSTIVTTLSGIGNWSYRIWANDTNGHSGYTAAYTLPVEWDSTWLLTIINSSGSISDDFGAVQGFKASTQTLGILIINNTGDYTLNFDLGSYPLSVYVAYNETEPFDLPSGSAKTIEVNAAIPDTPSEYAFKINISSSGGKPPFREINSTVISFIGGPYINGSTELTGYTVSMSQGSSGNFTVRIKNIGNETATYVWVNWTFPSGWSNISGDMKSMIGNMSPQETYSSTVTAYASSSAYAGASLVQVNSSCSEGSGGSDFVLVSLSCSSGDGICGSGCTYLTDDDCEAPKGGGGTTYTGTGGVIIVREPRMEVSIPERLDLTKGETYTFAVNISNPVANTNLTNIRVETSGYPEMHIKRSPSLINNIATNQTKSFLLSVSAPPYIEEKDYILSVVVRGTGVYGGGSQPLSASANVHLSVHGVAESESLAAIQDAETALNEMRDVGLSVETLSGMLDDARKAYADMDFDKAKGLAQDVSDLKEKAFRVLSLIGDMDSRIDFAKKYGISMEETRKMESLAKSAFQRGDYRRAEERVTAAITAYQLETKTLLPVLIFMHDNWHLISILILSIALVSIFSRKKLRIRNAGLRLVAIKNSKAVLKKMTGELQGDYYNKGETTKMDYNITRQSYEKRLAELNSEELRLATKLAAMKGKSRSKNLLEERENLKKRLADAQHDYYEKGGIGKNEYEETARVINEELASVEKGLSVLKKPHKKFTCVLLFVLFVSLFARASVAEEYVTAGEAAAAISQAEITMGEMRAMGLGIQYPNHTIEEAKLLLSRGDNGSALTMARYVSVIKQKAVTVDGMIDDVEVRIYELSSLGHNVSEAEPLLSGAIGEFRIENYEKAEETLGRAMDVLDSTEREAALLKATEKNVFSDLYLSAYENRLVILPSVFIILLIVAAVRFELRKSRKARMVRNLEKDIGSVKSSMMSLQEAYFVRGDVGRKSYDTEMKRYKEELSKAVESLELARKGSPGK